MGIERKSSAQAVALALATGLALPQAALAAGGHAIAVSAVILSKNNCTFSTASSSINVVIDPAAATPATGSGVVNFRCVGSDSTAVWSITDNGGLHSSGGKRMQHGVSATEYLPYSLNYSTSGTAPKNVTQTVTVTASVAPGDFQSALPGNYADTVVISIAP